VRVKIAHHEINTYKTLDIAEIAIFVNGAYTSVAPKLPSDLVNKDYIDTLVTNGLTPVNARVTNTKKLAQKNDLYYLDIVSRLGYTPLNRANKGVPNGYVYLNSTALVDLQEIPTSLSEIKEYPSKSDFPSVGQTNLIYINTSYDFLYRWTGSSYKSIYGSSGSSDYSVSLTNARKINGTSFNGTSNIVTTSWGNYKNVTIGYKTIPVNGTTNVVYSASDIFQYTPVNKAGDTMTGSLLVNTVTNDPSSIVNKEYVDSVVSSSIVFPVGGMIPYDFTAPTPVDFLRCNGALVNVSDYQKLYSVIGNDFRLVDIVGAGKPWQYQADIAYQTSNITKVIPNRIISQSIAPPVSSYYFDFKDNVIQYLGTDNYLYKTTINSDRTISPFNRVASCPYGTIVGTNLSVYSLECSIGTNAYGDYAAHYNQDGSLSSFSLISSYTTPNDTPIGNTGYYTRYINIMPSVCIKSNSKVYLIATQSVQYYQQLESNSGNPDYNPNVQSGNTLVYILHSYVYDIDQYGNLNNKIQYTPPSFSVDLAGGCSYNGYYYLVGCFKDSTSSCFVSMAKLSGGVLGQWSNIATLPITGTNYNFKGSCYIAGNTLYAVNNDNTLYYATINTDGTLSNWNTYTLPNSYMKAVPYSYNNKLYFIEEQYLTSDLDSNGKITTIKGEPNTINTLAPKYNNVVQYNLITVTKNRVYSYDPVADMFYSSIIGVDGSIQPTYKLPDLKIPFYTAIDIKNVNGTSVVYNRIYNEGLSYLVAHNCLYVFGGKGINVYRAPINTDGTLGQFDATILAPGNGIISSECFYYKGYVYHIGGYDTSLSSPTSQVWYAKIKDDTSLDTWYYGATLPVPGIGIGSFFTGKRVYVVLGNNNDTKLKVYYSVPSQDGGLSQWSFAGYFPELYASDINYGLYKIGFYVNSSTVYALYNSKLYRASINADGSISVWVPITSPIDFGQFLATSSYVYIYSNKGTYKVDLNGSTSDYSPYYDPNYYNNNIPTQFRLPNATNDTNPNIGYIIKT
jgi:hypothetical protein